MSRKQVTQELFPSAVAHLNTHFSSSALGYRQSKHSKKSKKQCPIHFLSSLKPGKGKFTAFTFPMSVQILQSKKTEVPPGKKKAASLWNS